MRDGTVVRGARSIEPLSGSVVTAGTFDGMHLGHRALAELAVRRARALGVVPVAYTFDPHPAKILAPTRAPPLLISVEERVRLLLSLGIERVVVEPFDAAFSEVSAEEWVEKYLVERLAPREVVVGFNFSYGRARGGDPARLAAAGRQHGFSVEIVGPVQHQGEVVSSSRLRALLETGAVEVAAGLLGRNFALTGVVEHGDHRGRTIGVPTANLAPDAELVPRPGVYASRVFLEDGSGWDAVTNIGTRPTFDGRGHRIEAHLFDFDRDLYGQHIRLELVARLRDERRFEGIDALVAQIHADIEAARQRLKR